jgi:hypothetical protein
VFLKELQGKKTSGKWLLFQKQANQLPGIALQKIWESQQTPSTLFSWHNLDRTLNESILDWG